MFVARGNLQTFPFPFLGKLPTLPNNCTELMPETFKKYESVCFSNLSEIHLSLLFNVKNHFECTWEMSQPRLPKSPFQVSFMTRRVFLRKGFLSALLHAKSTGGFLDRGVTGGVASI